MPISRTEILYLCTGAIAGFVVAKNFDKLKEKAGPLNERLGPLLETAAEAARDAYAAAARKSPKRLRRCRTQRRLRRARPHKSRWCVHCFNSGSQL